MCGDRIRHFVRSVAVDSVVLPRGLRRRVVGHFGLVEIEPPTVAVPERLIFLEVLDEETIYGDVVAVDDQAIFADVTSPVGARAVICAPHPKVVADDVAAVDRDAARRSPGGRAAHTTRNVVQ